MTRLEPDKYYHLFNRANGNEKIFKSPDNYQFFLRKYRMHIGPISETLCYCLMPNHFHFLIKIKIESKIRKLDNYKSEQDVSLYLSKQFSNLFSSYTQAFNKFTGRRGSLFMRAFKRKLIEDEVYLRNLVKYIHSNPVKAGLSKTPQGWKHSSYAALISEDFTFLKRNEVLAHFDGIKNFKFVHHHPTESTDYQL